MKKILKRTSSALCSAAVALSAAFPGAVTTVFAEEQSPETAAAKPAVSLSVPELRFTAGQKSTLPEPVAAYTPITSDIELYGDSAGLPAKYDMRYTHGITPVRIQSPHGTCWVHSAVASAETSLLQSVPDIDLSELHTAFYTYFGSDQLEPEAEDIEGILSVGGNSRMVMNLWAQWIGPVFESRLPYDDLHFFDDDADTYFMKEQSDYHLKNAYEFDFNSDRSNFDEINSLVKQFVISGEAVDISFMSDTEKNYYPEYSSSNTKRIARFADHSVAVIGWDDSFPAEHFRNSPEGDGAWLCKNSWGSLFGEDGYIWISYYDRSLCEFTVFELEDADNSTMIFQHDSFIPIQLMSAYDTSDINGPSYMANVFYAVNETEIDSVGTYIYNPGTEYEITVYTGLTDKNIPSSGTPSEVTHGICDMTGFLTLGLDKGVYVPEGEYFGVSIKLYCPDTPFVIPFESSIYAEHEGGEVFDIGSYGTFHQINALTGRAESFFSPDGVNWTDMTDSDFTYSDEEKQALLASFTEQLYDGLEPEDTELLENAAAAVELYTQLFENNDIKVKMGNISLKAYGNPAGAVKFSHVKGEVPLDEAIGLSAANGEPIYYDIISELDNSRYQGPLLYDEPIKITEPVQIRAWTRDDEWYVRSYRPKEAGFTFIGYDTSYPEYDAQLKYAKKISGNEFVISIDPEKESVRFYPGTVCDITLNGTPCEPYSFTEGIAADYGVTDVVFSLSGENVLDNEVTVHIERMPVEFDLEKETLSFSESTEVYAPDGTRLADGAYVGDLAGQSLTVKLNGDTIDVAVPERHDVSGLEIDYRRETLGLFEREIGELLDYSVMDAPDPEDFILALTGRFVFGHSNEDQSFWGLTVIPGETITVRVRAGNGKFASEMCTYIIPEAPEAPKEMPGYTIDDEGDIVFDDDGKYQLAKRSEPNEEFFSLSAMSDGYEVDMYIKLMSERFGMDKYEDISSAYRSVFLEAHENFTGDGYLRYAATDTQFASKAITVVLPGGGNEAPEPGDVNRDGFVDAVDASMVLAHYAAISTNGVGELDSEQQVLADINGDRFIDAVDASMILAIYAQRSTQR